MKPLKTWYYQTDGKSGLDNELKKAINEADLEADRFAARCGASGFYPDMSAVAGGVSAVLFADPSAVDMDKWKSIGKDADGLELFVPNTKLKNAEAVRIEEERQRLPRLTVVQLYRLLGADPMQDLRQERKRGKSFVVAVGVPKIFKWCRCLYIESNYECRHADLLHITKKGFIETEKEMNRKIGDSPKS